MKRAVVLSLLFLLSIGVLVPLATEWSEASKTKIHRKKKKIKKYSKAWWKRHRAMLRRKRALAARRKQASAANAKNPEIVKVSQKTATVLDAPVAGWTGEAFSPNGEAKFRVADTSGKPIGSAQLAVVGASVPQPATAEVPAKMRDKTLAGVPVSNLRRTVIDKMIREEGWIVNDYQREVNGKKVFVVVAQTNTGGTINSRLFYFTEINGRIYSLSTNAPNNYADKIAADSEQFIQKLQKGAGQAEEITASTNLR
jgi:hypothetical protein